MNLPARYNKLLATLPAKEVSYGCGGIRLFDVAEFQQGQVGYSILSNGTSLCSKKDGAWQPSWIVIGIETATGDPIFIDTLEPALPVLTAIHGQGEWEPLPIATSVEVFVKLLEQFACISKGRSNPVELESNLLSDSERGAFLTRVKELNEGQFELLWWWWDDLLQS